MTGVHRPRPAIMARRVLLAPALFLACSTPASRPEVHVDPHSQIELVRVPAGTFIMGSPEAEEGREAQEIRHRVEISKAFHLGRFEVTQAQWSRVMDKNPSEFSDCPDCPVANVSWIETQEFLHRLSRASGRHYRLPTEAE